MPTSINDLLTASFSLPTILVLVIGAMLILWLGILSYWTWHSVNFSRKLFGDTRREDLKEILQEHMSRVGAVQIRISDMERMLGQIEHKSKRHISKVGVIRFNPFDDTGGDQSFVLALLDDSDDGVVISSLHGRDRSRIYAKPVKQGDAADYNFSEEEIEAIRQARVIGHK